MADITGTGFAGSMGGVVQRLVGTVTKGGVIVLLIVILGGILTGIMLYVRYRRLFVYSVRIKRKRSAGIGGKEIFKIAEDKGAFIRNRKDGTVWFRLLNEKVDLTPPPLECIKVGIGGKNYIDIWQPSDEEYYYMLEDEIKEFDVVLRDNNGLKQDTKLVQHKAKIIGGSSAYWNVLRKREQRKMFDTESLINKLLPYIVPVLMFMLVIFMTYMITQHWGEFSAAASALKEAAQALRDMNLAQVSSSPIPTGTP